MLKAAKDGKTVRNSKAAPTTFASDLPGLAVQSHFQRTKPIVRRFLELQVPMLFGALVCYLLTRLIPASGELARIYYPGTFLYAVGDVFFLAVPVGVWMIMRRRDYRHSLEMTIAMMTPVAAIIAVGEISGVDYLEWLLTAGYPAMSLGMLVDLTYRRDYFTR